MTFAESLTEYSAAQIIAATGCPRGTAYDWKDGRREPPSWQQVHWLRIIQAFPVAVRTPKPAKGVVVELVAAKRARKKMPNK
tara:strand:+ start:469 stop:714 length:246 start_codon:yes stop_codon:yes gene_type:complete